MLDRDGPAHRAWLARAITLVESTRPDHRAMGQELLVALAAHAGGTASSPGPSARRVGVTGVPGVGKSTFIDALGTHLTAAGHRVAVLAVDPSSTRTGGSILGDKTRMTRLATDPAAFVRPSPTSGTLGGVARATREAMLIVEAAGYDVVLVETVGVGQSETTVAEMVDSFLLLALARTGDQLQGIKKGVLELADVIAVNKADGPHEADARKAARELAGALRLLRPPAAEGAPERPPGSAPGRAPGSAPGKAPGSAPDKADAWQTPVVTCSGLTGAGLPELWQQLERHHESLQRTGELQRRRQRQQLGWVWSMARDALLDSLRTNEAVKALTPEVERRVLAGTMTPGQAAEALLRAFHGKG
ncbi:methylmalonyl Co-A mutase-associated GTPase MeaB [Dactylosporangium roseum]|uniref:methylmalonyl Co-A mutase-associated GTPase MeaB n=1 Tax=Dactylosporangium roseum TaxID=47989 RepID=UPI0021B4784E|nr:methylmalonyl Co-A mutase-associated GTPase MeaB [Dactylosporangium roseum]